MTTKVSSLPKVYAHCDVPCGVYEPDSMRWAVETCEKMVDKLLHLELPAYIDYHNTFSRGVSVKEEYAEIAKKQVLILWTDYFKPEHLQKWPDLHQKIWMATKQCSVVKRTVNMDEVRKLRTMIEEIATIFAESKK